MGRFKWTARASIVVDLVKIAGFAFPVIAAYVFLDYFLAFDPESLKTINAALALTTLAAVAIAAAKTAAISNKDVCDAIDKAAEDSRRTTRTALELRQNQNTEAEIPEFLLNAVTDKAMGNMAETPLLATFPKKAFKRALLKTAVLAVATTAILAASYDISAVSLRRIAAPNEDIPPYTKYRFSIKPERPEALYGGGIELTVEISGRSIDGAVVMRTRRQGVVASAPCFNAGKGKYARKLEKITTPLDFCFAVGRKRSKWLHVKVKTIPRILFAGVEIQPPKYTRLRKDSFALGQNPLKLLKGSHVSLEITTNRPLSEGRLTLKYDDGSTETIDADTDGGESTRFSWTAKANASIAATVKDLQGAETEAPLEFRQIMLDDAPPDIAITSPESFVLATPDAKIDIEGEASDDFGLERVDILRGIKGYRDRQERLQTSDAPKNISFKQSMDLDAIGAEPGDTIEIYAETMDSNPDMTGFDDSEIVKIKVISKQEYAKILRDRIKVETIIKRYAVALEAFENVKKKLAEFKRNLGKKDFSKKSMANALEKLKKANETAKRAFQALAKDFPIYEMEKEQRALFKELYGKTVRAETALDAIRLDAPRQDIARATRKILDSFTLSTPKTNALARKLDEIKALARIMRSAAEFKRLVAKQDDIVKRVERFKTDTAPDNPGALKKLGKREAEIERKLELLKKEIVENADRLPKNYAQLARDAKVFVGKIDSIRIPEELRAAKNAAEKLAGFPAAEHAEKALELMRQLLKGGRKNNQFRQMMKGMAPTKCDGSCDSNAAQMLSSILRRFGDGQAKGAYGAGGEGGSGSTANSSSMLNTPLIGPKRTSFAKGRAGRKGKGAPTGTGGRGEKHTVTKTLVENNADSETRENKTMLETDPVSIDDAPFEYRNAVKKYFSSEDDEK
jgi:tetratricopeptide (TPR) repeat protein